LRTGEPCRVLRHPVSTLLSKGLKDRKDWPARSCSEKNCWPQLNYTGCRRTSASSSRMQHGLNPGLWPAFLQGLQLPATVWFLTSLEADLSISKKPFPRLLTDPVRLCCYCEVLRFHGLGPFVSPAQGTQPGDTKNFGVESRSKHCSLKCSHEACNQAKLKRHAIACVSSHKILTCLRKGERRASTTNQGAFRHRQIQ